MTRRLDGRLDVCNTMGMTTDGMYQDQFGYFIRVRNGNIENLSGMGAPAGDYTEPWHGPLAAITDPLARRMAAFLSANRP